MLQKLDMKIPVEILGLDDVNITEVHLRNHRESRRTRGAGGLTAVSSP